MLSRTLPLGSIHLVSISFCTLDGGTADAATVEELAAIADMSVGGAAVGGGRVLQKTIKESLTKCGVGGTEGVSLKRLGSGDDDFSPAFVSPMLRPLRVNDEPLEPLLLELVELLMLKLSLVLELVVLVIVVVVLWWLEVLGVAVVVVLMLRLFVICSHVATVKKKFEIVKYVMMMMMRIVTDIRFPTFFIKIKKKTFISFILSYIRTYTLSQYSFWFTTWQPSTVLRPLTALTDTTELQSDIQIYTTFSPDIENLQLN